MWQFRRYPDFFTSGGPGSGLYRTTDGGETWTELTEGLPEGEKGRIAVAIAPSRPAVVYATVESEDTALYRSDDLGNTWRMTDNSTNIQMRPWYFSELVVDPTRSQPGLQTRFHPHRQHRRRRELQRPLRRRLQHGLGPLGPPRPVDQPVQHQPALSRHRRRRLHLRRPGQDLAPRPFAAGLAVLPREPRPRVALQRLWRSPGQRLVEGTRRARPAGSTAATGRSSARATVSGPFPIPTMSTPSMSSTRAGSSPASTSPPASPRASSPSPVTARRSSASTGTPRST